MTDSILHCPKCNEPIQLTESLAAPLVAATRRQFEARMAEKEQETAAREQAARAALEEAQRAKAAVADDVAARLAAGRQAIAEEEARKAQALLSAELADKERALAESRVVLKDRDDKLAAAREAQADLLQRERELEDAKSAMALTVEQRLKEAREQFERDAEKRLAERDAELARERAQIYADATRKAEAQAKLTLAEKDSALAAANELIKEREDKLAVAHAAQLDLMKRERALEDAKRELEVSVETRVRESLAAERAKAKAEAEDALRLTITERDTQIAGMVKQIEDLKKRAEQGSQQLQGEALELELESLLRGKFPVDGVAPVPKGEFGGDVVQTIIGVDGRPCGTILWESKRTKAWSDGWLVKLREDQRRAKADLAILISDALPKDVQTFDLVGGVWVTERRCALPVAIALRQSLLDLAKSRQAQDGQQTKMEMLYGYLTGPRFRHRIEAIVEKFADMQADLAREKKATMKNWAKRDLQIQGVIEATVGMYGDMQGIAGRAMQEIPALEVPLLESAPAPDAEAREDRLPGT